MYACTYAHSLLVRRWGMAGVSHTSRCMVMPSNGLARNTHCKSVHTYVRAVSVGYYTSTGVDWLTAIMCSTPTSCVAAPWLFPVDGPAEHTAY